MQNQEEIYFNVYQYVEKPRDVIQKQEQDYTKYNKFFSCHFFQVSGIEQNKKQILARNDIQPIYSKFKQNIDQQYKKQLLSYQKHKYLPSKPFLQNLVYKQQQAKESIIFSNFESGNIHLCKIQKNVYKLLMTKDTNTNGFTQWFFFGVHPKTNQKIIFNISNFRKNQSLFNQGMRVVKLENGIFSRGPPAFYYKNQMKNNGKQLYSLQFQFTFKSNQPVYFSYHYPYTYSRLQKFLLKLSSNRNIIFKKLLTRTLSKNRVDMIIITNFRQFAQKKKVIYIFARVHPGQTVSSFVVEGIIKFLIDTSKEAHYLRKFFIFKIIPMLNPDGVIHGNYRCSLSGCDLNRKWINPDKFLHPQIYHLKRNILQTSKSQQIVAVFDLHGHSKCKNSFIYGCSESEEFDQAKIFPYLLSKIDPNFSFSNCNFQMKKQKQSTARIRLFHQLQIPHVYTMQTSFCGNQESDYHFTTNNLFILGQNLCKTILYYFQNKDSYSFNKQINYQEIKNQMISQVQFQKTNVAKDSDSQPQKDALQQKYVRNVLMQTNFLSLYKLKKKTNKLTVSKIRLCLQNKQPTQPKFIKYIHPNSPRDKNKHIKTQSQSPYATKRQSLKKSLQFMDYNKTSQKITMRFKDEELKGLKQKKKKQKEIQMIKEKKQIFLQRNGFRYIRIQKIQPNLLIPSKEILQWPQQQNKKKKKSITNKTVNKSYIHNMHNSIFKKRYALNYPLNVRSQMQSMFKLSNQIKNK